MSRVSAEEFPVQELESAVIDPVNPSKNEVPKVILKIHQGQKFMVLSRDSVNTSRQINKFITYPEQQLLKVEQSFPELLIIIPAVILMAGGMFISCFVDRENSYDEDGVVW
jgi:hypothetical protein